MDQTLHKRERLINNQLSSILFTKGDRSYISGFIFFKLLSDKEDASILPSVEVVFVAKKKLFKKAVDRNYIKRLLRESYRKNKYVFYDLPSLQHKRLLLGIVYVGKKLPVYEKCENAIKDFFFSL